MVAHIERPTRTILEVCFGLSVVLVVCLVLPLHWLVFKGSPTQIHAAGIWALPVRGGGVVSTLAQMIWSTFLEKNFPSSNGHFHDFGGVRTLARMVWGSYAVKIEVIMGICLC